jgi:NitT/TauT family transport system ATP-binding protein
MSYVDQQEHAPADGSFIVFDGLAKNFFMRGNAVRALGPVSLSVRRGEFLALLGPSGCGKSTTLNMTAGLMRPSAGQVMFDGQPVLDVNTKVGYLTQRDTLMPWRTVKANIALPLEIKGVAPAERAEMVAGVLAAVGLSDFASHYPSELSGGMRRRAALARMLVSSPETLLMDEPFGALDAQLRLAMQAELLKLWQAERKTVLFVTHDLAEALILADRIVVFSPRPGRVKAIFDVPIPRPRDVYTLQFEPEFLTLQKELWTCMREDFAKGEEMK